MRMRVAPTARKNITIANPINPRAVKARRII
jgi:hypothetical protein